MSSESHQRVAVVTDSTAYLRPDLVKEHGIHVVPLYLMLGGETWLDGVEIDPPAFYEKRGYRVFGELQDFPPGHRRYFLTKPL